MSLYNYFALFTSSPFTTTTNASGNFFFTPGMADIAAAIAPRKLIVINGKLDNIFPQAGVEECFDTIKAIYTAAGVPESCALATGQSGHRYYAAEAWAAFDGMENWND